MDAHFLALSPDFASLLTSPPQHPMPAMHDFAFAHILQEPNTPTLTLSFPQASQEYPPLAGSIPPELMQLFGVAPQLPIAPQQQLSQDVPLSHPTTLSFPPELLAQVPAQTAIIPPQLDIKAEFPMPMQGGHWLSYMFEPDVTNALPFQSSLISPQTIGQQQQFPIVNISAISSCPSVPYPTQQPITHEHIKQEIAPTPTQQLPPTATPQSSALQKLHQRLLQRLRKSQADGPSQSLEQDLQGGLGGEGDMEPAQNIVVSDASKKADSSFNKVLELFSYYFNTQKTASPLACTAALYLPHFFLLFFLYFFLFFFLHITHSHVILNRSRFLSFLLIFFVIFFVFVCSRSYRVTPISNTSPSIHLSIVFLSSIYLVFLFTVFRCRVSTFEILTAIFSPVSKYLPAGE